jgi:hypothetical protein
VFSVNWGLNRQSYFFAEKGKNKLLVSLPACHFARSKKY